MNRKQVLVNKIPTAAEDEGTCGKTFSTSQDEVEAGDTGKYYYHYHFCHFCLILLTGGDRGNVSMFWVSGITL